LGEEKMVGRNPCGLLEEGNGSGNSGLSLLLHEEQRDEIPAQETKGERTRKLSAEDNPFDAERVTTVSSVT